MRILITAGPTWEAIDPVRYIGNRSSGKMGVALVDAAIGDGHRVTAITGPGVGALPDGADRIDVESSGQMLQAVMRDWPGHDLLIMAAAVADYRPRSVAPGKMERREGMVIELEATTDIVATAAGVKRTDQRVVAFSLEQSGGMERARAKMLRKKVDMMVFNRTETMGSDTIDATFLFPDGRSEPAGCREKRAMADILLRRALALFA